MRRFWRRSGSGNSILRSRRPGRKSAGSSVSARFVAMITLRLVTTKNAEREKSAWRMPYTDVHLDSQRREKSGGVFMRIFKCGVCVCVSCSFVWLFGCWCLRFVHLCDGARMNTFTLTVTSKPSIWLRSSRRMRCTSRSAPVCASKRFVAIASISSMKMIAGAFSRASRNTSRTCRRSAANHPQSTMNALFALRK